MMADVRTLNKKYWFKFPRFLKMILETKYPQLQQTVSIYDTKIMNHMVYSMLNKVRIDVQVTYQNRKSLVKFGEFSKIVKQVQEPVNAAVAVEHDIKIIDAPHGSHEPIENIDLTGVESEQDDVFDEMLMDDAEFGEIRTETNIESLTADKPNEDQPLNNVTEDPATDLHPRKRSRRDPRISREIDVETRSNLESTIPVVTERPPVHVSGTPVSEAIIEFILNPRAPMYMPAPKSCEGSSNTPSNVDVLKAAALLQQVTRAVVAATEPNQQRTQEAPSSPDNEELFEDNEVAILMKRITTLEEDKIFKDVQIASLMEEITHKNQQIHEFETNLGSLTAVVMDLKKKLEGKFPKEFAKPPKEYTTEERAQMYKEREEAINRYILNSPRTANQKMKQKEVIMRNVRAERNFGFQNQPDRYVITTQNDRFDVYDNMYGIVSWAYNDEKGMFLVKRKNGAVEDYNNADAFKSWTTLDLRELSQDSYHDQCRDHNCQIGWNFFNKLKQRAKVNFRDMKLAQLFVVEHEDVLDPSTNKPLNGLLRSKQRLFHY
ncbi:hypothetical protein Hdeb2414_s0006g00218021 [Helianthus debilis subsp. tardiflorus]